MCDHSNLSNAIPLGYIEPTTLPATRDKESSQMHQYSVVTVVEGCSERDDKRDTQDAAITVSQDQTKAIVPLSSSLPSKILRLNARRSLQQRSGGAAAAGDDGDSDDDVAVDDNDMEGACALPLSNAQCCQLEDEFMTFTDLAQAAAVAPNTSPASSISPAPPSPQSLDSSDDKLIDVGMGSSIECSDESAEEDDELKPLAIDNHTPLNRGISIPMEMPQQQQSLLDSCASPPISVLSEVNLEKFRHHHHHHHHHYNHTDNIYYHPNYNFQPHALAADEQKTSVNGDGGGGALAADANLNDDAGGGGGGGDGGVVSGSGGGGSSSSPPPPRRVHRSFLTITKKQSSIDLDPNDGNATTSSGASSGASSAGNSIDIQSSQTIANEIDTLDPADIPDDDLSADICEQVEYYFSNDSILKDAFLLKHVRRNKEGFVSLKLVSSFKRVRQLTKDWKVVGYAVRRMSKKIELNDLGTKVRRIEPLPNFDETMPSRTIVACDLPFEKLTIEKVSDIFAKCGEIALIRILKPGMAIPVDVRQFMNKYPEMQQKDCALVEFVDSTSARDAKSLVGSFQVYDMVAPKKKTGKKATMAPQTVGAGGGAGANGAAPVAKMVESYRLQENGNYERARGGSFSGVVSSDATDLRYKLRRNLSSSIDYHSAKMAGGGDAFYQYNHHSQQPYHPHLGLHHSQQQLNHYHSRNSISNQGHEMAANMSPPIGGNMNFYASSPRRYSNTSVMTSAQSNVPISNENNSNNNNNNNNNQSNAVRRFSNCSDSYSTCSELSRRQSICSETASASRRNSTCSENCPCSRRVSQCPGGNEAYRKLSQGSSDFSSSGIPPPRRSSNGSFQFERTYSNPTEMQNHHQQQHIYPRRMSNDFNLIDRKQSIETNSGGILYENDGNVGGGGGGYNTFRRYSNNFDPNRKLSNYDQYINGRRISTDSGYDRRYSFGSDFEGSPRSRTSSFLNSYKNDYDGSPRSRTGSFLNSYKSTGGGGEFDGSPRSRSGSFLNAHKNAENLVRTPIGPDGSKGFGSRARKFGQIIAPVN